MGSFHATLKPVCRRNRCSCCGSSYYSCCDYSPSLIALRHYQLYTSYSHLPLPVQFRASLCRLLFTHKAYRQLQRLNNMLNANPPITYLAFRGTATVKKCPKLELSKSAETSTAQKAARSCSTALKERPDFRKQQKRFTVLPPIAAGQVRNGS